MLPPDGVDDGDVVFLTADSSVEEGALAIVGIESGTAAKLVIPSELGGKKVVEIGARAFEDKTWMQAVDIPHTIQLIGDEAFKGCKSLGSVAIPPNCQLGYSAFYRCSALANVEIGEGAILGTTGVNEWDDGYWDYDEETDDEIWVAVPRSERWANDSSSVFAYCSSLREVSLPSSITTIPNNTFAYCTTLGQVTLPEGLKRIGWQAFESCSNIASLKLPSTLESVEGYAFFGLCPSEKLVLPASLTSFGLEAFVWYSNGEWRWNEETEEDEWVAGDAYTIQTATWQQYWSLQDNPNLINRDTTEVLPPAEEDDTPTQLQFSENEDGEAVVTGCTVGSQPGTGIVIPATWDGKPVTEIGSKAFENQTWLESVQIPASVQKIGESGFQGCKSLKAVVIPANCQIGSEAFYRCVELESVRMGEGAILGISGVNEWDDGYWDYDEETDDEIWVAVPRSESWTNDSYNVFAYCSSLREVSLPADMTFIPDSSFSGCESLERIDLPKGLLRIGNWAFGDCSELSAFVLPSGLKSIGDYAFYGCQPADTVVLPTSLNALGSLCFQNWYVDGTWEWDEEADESLWVPDRRYQIQASTWLQYWKLQGNSRLITASSTDVVPPDGTAAGPVKFTWELNDDGTVTITGLAEEPPANLVVPAEIATVDVLAPQSAFSVQAVADQASSLTMRKVSAIGAGAFEGADALETVVLPETLERIEAGAFSGCASLASVYIPGVDTVVEEGAFDAPSELEESAATLEIICAQGSKAEEYAQSNGIASTSSVPLSLVTVEVEEPLVFGCDPSSLPVVVKMGETQLEEGSDYELVFGEPASAGLRGVITVKAVQGGAYSGEQYASYAVVPAEFSHAKIGEVVDQVFADEPVCPKPAVVLGDIVLEEGVDFTYAWLGNDAPGLATVKAIGIGNYEGEVSRDFSIVAPLPPVEPSEPDGDGAKTPADSDTPEKGSQDKEQETPAKESAETQPAPESPEASAEPSVTPEPVPAEPEPPVVQPEQPTSGPETPVAEPEQPVAQPEAPVAGPEAPVAQPEAPVAQPEAPVAQPEQPTVPEAKPGASAGASGANAAATKGSGFVVLAPVKASLNQNITLKVKSKKLKAKQLKRKAISFKIGAKAAGGGKLSYTLSKKAKKAKIKVSKKGKVTVRKGTKKGTYKITVKAAAKGVYKSAKATVTIKVK